MTQQGDAQVESESTQATDDTGSQDNATDWKAEAESAKTESAQLRQQLKTEQGRLNKQLNIENTLSSLTDRLDASEARSTKAQLFMAQAIKEGDTAGLEGQLGTLDAERRQSTQNTRMVRTAGKLQEQIVSALAGDDLGNPLVAPDSVEYRKILNDWDAAIDDKASSIEDKLSDMSLIVADAHQVASQIKDKKMQDQLKEGEKAVERVRKESFEDSGALDNDLGKGVPSAPETLDSLVAKDTRKMSVSDLAEQKKKVLAGLKKNPASGRS